jgi:hypothetical protein
VVEVQRLRREQPELTLAQIAVRVEETFGAPCAVKTVRDYLWDPTGDLSRHWAERRAGAALERW